MQYARISSYNGFSKGIQDLQSRSLRSPVFYKGENCNKLHWYINRSLFIHYTYLISMRVASGLNIL